MYSYRKLRAKYKKDILLGECFCILSGLQIYDKKFLSIEHLVPKSRVSYKLAEQEENIYPAYKILNQLKSDLLFCEWQKQKIKILQKVLKKNKLKKKEREIIQEAIDNSKFYHPNTCEYCILSQKCKKSR